MVRGPGPAWDHPGVGFPTGIGIVDGMIGFPIRDRKRVYDRLITATETALLHLSEAVSSTFLGRNEPAETREELPS